MEKVKHCHHCTDLKEENQRLRDVLTYLAAGQFCTPHMKVKIFSALNPPINKEENHERNLNRV
jgi:hypothetical protein